MKGLFSALLVPFDEKGQVLEKGLRELVRYNIEVQKIDGLYVNGSSGENFMMSKEQKKQVFKIVSEEVNGEVPLIAQVGSINIDEAIELGKYATELGYDSLSAVTPFYYKFSFQEIKAYYESILKETGNTMLIYAIPSLTGVAMSMEQFDALFQNEKIIGVKFTDSNFFLLERLRRRFPHKLIYSGFDEMLIYGVVSGVDGAIGSTYNINGQRAKQIFDLCHKGQLKEAYAIQHTCNDLIERVLDLGIFATLKEILKVKGVEAGTVKSPMQALDESKRSEIEALVRTFDL
ncbi:N-acetylneuraminate lyase [Pullulanibacillus pueri]|uniref:N-acetylneuraminate lyase n=1 Tax=Pullulanibacillus pueri TaxID=1437324 RepID=A0A8J2ZV89_9BACL|nr:N-acetylneuraminate lyase [Pullulanibacillus pueri]MBM7682104.1 N-acetylneuraminate lyase [Pullulanibacillus pueri]GGH79965.1 N-acetylneuraminate lyase [Pullulanibacillus pueri]